MTFAKHTLLAAFLLASGMVPLAPAFAEDAVATHTAIAPPPEGKGQIVFFRSGSIMGAAISCAVHENGAKISSLAPGHYAVVVADPGKHAYTVESEAKDTLNVMIESGEVQYATCHVKMGIMAGRPVLAPATEAEFNKHSYARTAAPAPAPAATPAPTVQ